MKIKKKQPLKTKNHIVLVVDSSGSMGIIRRQAIDAVNKQFNEIKKQSKETGQETLVTFIKFANKPEIVYSNLHVDDLENLSYSDFQPDGMTALFDAVGKAVHEARHFSDKNTSNLILIITDGEENLSTIYSAEDVKAIIEGQTKEGNWTFAFQLPRGHAVGFSKRFGVSLDNIQEWDNTEIGTQVMSDVQTSGIANYYSARSAGNMSVDSFYTKTDLSHLKPKQIKTNLVDISNKFKMFTVDKEVPIKEFVQKKTGKDYVIGSAFYELTKTELVQPTKDVLIIEKGKSEVWGGDNARNLIGLPKNANAKVEPFNHANYQVFVNSTSVNRKLVRGTKVLVDVNMQVGKEPTWK